MDFQPVAVNQEVKTTLACLGDKKGIMTGEFDFKGQVAAQGKSGALFNSLQGNLKFDSRKGRIYRYGVLGKILAFLNLSETFRGKLPDIVERGFAYKTITADGDIKGSILTLNKVHIDGRSMEVAGQGDIDLIEKKLDLQVLLAPFKTVDYIVKKTPILGDILGGTLVTIPVKVTGSYENPEIAYLSGSGVGSELKDIMKNTLKSPFKIFQPDTPKGEEKPVNGE
jgi:uncharacterized protein YhdP